MEPGSLIAAAGNIQSAGINALVQGSQNRANRRFAREMYDRQFQDNIRFWEMQNQYNDPAAQMQRFKDAGLNPNLIYGSGSASAGNAGSISSPTASIPEGKTPDLSGIAGAANSIARYQDFELREQQLDGMKLDNEFKAIRNVTAGFDQGSKGIDYNVKSYNFENKLHEYNLDAARTDLKQKTANLQFTSDENVRRAVTTSRNLAESLERVLSMQMTRLKTQDERDLLRQSIRNLRVDEDIKKRELMMRELGWTPGSPAWMGVVTTLINNILNR